MIMIAIFTVFCIGSLLVIGIALRKGKLEIENVCTLTREKPIEFYGVLLGAGIVLATLGGLCAWTIFAEVAGALQWSADSRT